MRTLPSIPQTAKSIRIAALLATVLCMAATGIAGDALTTTTDSTTTTHKSLLSSLFSSKSSSSDTGSTTKTNLTNGILGLPIGIIKSIFSGASKVVNKTVSKHISTN